jgi:hypothetical protein
MMENERCIEHGITRCPHPKCRSKLLTELVTPPKPRPVVLLAGKAGPPAPALAPPSITNAAPADIEMMDAPAVREEATELRKAQGVYDKEMEDLLAAKARQEAINAAADIGIKSEPAPKTDMGHAEASIDPEIDYVKIAGFETLPVDDSHASQVMRAASAYADAARDYALKLASYTKVAEGLKTAGDRLTEAINLRDQRERELKEIVDGGTK